MSKPKVLYHGSGIKGIQEFIPKQETFRHKREGPVVFASESKAFTTIFMSPKMNDDWTQSGNINGVNYIIISDEERFRKGDKGGSVYVLPSDTFYQDLTLGMKTEWVSKQPVRPLEEIEYPSTLEAMLVHDIAVYFISKDEFQTFKNKPNWDESLDMMQSWKKYS